MKKILSLLPFAATLLSISLTASAQNKAKPRPAPAADTGKASTKTRRRRSSASRRRRISRSNCSTRCRAREQGSWVNLCVDRQRPHLSPAISTAGSTASRRPPPGQPLDPATIEKVPAEIRAVNGMLWAFGALYVGVNDYEKQESQRPLSRHGQRRRRPARQGGAAARHRGQRRPRRARRGADAGRQSRSILICGNGAKPTECAATSPRAAASGAKIICCRACPTAAASCATCWRRAASSTASRPTEKTSRSYASGFRNIFDAAFNRDGELFTYDADMEYDFNTPWYRPTRINHVVSGAEFGWRNGAGKRPEWYPDNLPPVLNIGPGSPTGVTFGYGAKFPAKYQNALFALDWSWGKLYAVHLEPKRRELHGDEGGIPLRRAAAADRRDHSSRQTARCISRSAGARCSRALSRDLHRQRIDRARRRPTADGQDERATCGTSSRLFTASRIRKAVARRVAASRQTRTASSAGPRAPRSSISPSRRGQDKALDRNRSRASRSRRCWRSRASPASTRSIASRPIRRSTPRCARKLLDALLKLDFAKLPQRAAARRSCALIEIVLRPLRPARRRRRSPQLIAQARSALSRRHRRAELAALRNARLSAGARRVAAKAHGADRDGADAGGADRICALAAHAEDRLDARSCARR